MLIQSHNLCIEKFCKKWIRGEYGVSAISENGFFTFLFYRNTIYDHLFKFNFDCLNFNKIYENGGKEFLQSEFKDFKHTLNEEIEGKKFSLCIEINLEKYKKSYEHIPFKIKGEEREKLRKEIEDSKNELEKIIKPISEKLSKFRINLYSYVIKHYLNMYKEKKSQSSFSLNLNKTNILYIVSSDNSTDFAYLVYCLNFTEPYEQLLCDLFLKEFKNKKNADKKLFTVDLYDVSHEIPNIIKEIDDVSKYSNGFIVFNISLKNVIELSNYLTFFVTFREYIAKYIKFIKISLRKAIKEKGKDFKEKYDKLQNKYLEDPDCKKLAVSLFRDGIAKDLKNI